mmetsp:Transcript_11408/g.28087  ORF Transcript_11408/g.28087 Transcript_11408/m.28087 type:complete len:85 (-) Transcript_11408:494-748(-)
MDFQFSITCTISVIAVIENKLVRKVADAKPALKNQVMSTQYLGRLQVSQPFWDQNPCKLIELPNDNAVLNQGNAGSTASHCPFG